MKLTKSQLKEMIREELMSEGKLNEAGKYRVSSQPFRAWKEHDEMNDKLYGDLHWAMKAFPTKKKEIQKLMKLSNESGNLIKIIIFTIHLCIQN